MLKNLLIQMAQELEFRLEESKGGNVPGVTEDHRYQMGRSLQAVRSALEPTQPRECSGELTP